MTDELNQLRKAFLEGPEPRASKHAKKAAIEAAMAAFEEEKLANRQGIESVTRLKKRDNKFVDLLTFSRWRQSMKPMHVIPGLVGLAALSFVVLNTYQFTPSVNHPRPAPELVELDLNDAAAKTDEEQEAKRGVVEEAQPPIGQASKETLSPIAKETNIASLAKSPNKVRNLRLSESQITSQTSDDQAGRVRSSENVFSKFKAQTITPESVTSDLTFVDRTDRELPRPAENRDVFDTIEKAPLKLTQDEPVSTFSIDVDTAAYSFMRASLNQNRLPPKNAVRTEEYINYFPYDYAAPKDKSTPFSVNTSVYPSPWNQETRLLHIAIKGYELDTDSRPQSNLVFLVDTSGSMNQANKLPLLKNAFKMLLSTLSVDDTISIVVYAGSAGVVLEPTSVQNKATILDAFSRLHAGGPTAGGEGIRLAYQLAQENFNPKGVNRVILATDGDFNVGMSDQSSLKGFIERKRDSGVYLSVLGFGMGNYNDALMQTLAQNGNGIAAYIDSIAEARKVLVEEATSTLITIAKDVKIQMEFNPNVVSEYRLIGYASRKLKKEDFNNDKVDAGEVGAGHSVTAIYEITPTNSAGKRIDNLRYQPAEKPIQGLPESEYGFLKVRYKLPDETSSKLIERPIRVDQSLAQIEMASDDARFASAVAAFGQLLRGGRYTGEFDFDDVINLAQAAKGADSFGYRSEFISLVRQAKLADKM